MKVLLSAFALVSLLCLAVGPAASQNGTITVYFDENFTQRAMDCPGPGIGTLYVVAEGFDVFFAGMEFAIAYPPSMIWLTDVGTPPVTIGNSPNGVSMGWALPKNGFQQVLLMKATVLWNCTDCSGVNQSVKVVPHPLFGQIQGADFPDYNLIYGTGRESVVCPYAALDIKPGSCPNPFNVKLADFAGENKPNKGGVLPVALLGSDTFDATTVDLSSLRLEGVEPLLKGGPKVVDVAGPAMDGGDCACTTAGPDGYPDVMMRFQAQEIAAAIAPLYEGDRALTLTGYYLDGVPFEATDCVQIVGHVTDLPVISSEPEFVSASPNPFNPVTRLTYSVPRSEHVSLAVYDVTGRLVARLVDGVVEPGEHTVEWSAAGVASGVYFGRLQAGSVEKAKRLVLLK